MPQAAEYRSTLASDIVKSPLKLGTGSESSRCLVFQSRADRTHYREFPVHALHG